MEIGMAEGEPDGLRPSGVTASISMGDELLGVSRLACEPPCPICATSFAYAASTSALAMRRWWRWPIQ